jgi:hypothetical protein
MTTESSQSQLAQPDASFCHADTPWSTALLENGISHDAVFCFEKQIPGTALF